MRSLRVCCFLAQLRSLGRICQYLCEITHLNPMFGHLWINCIRCVYRGSQARGRGHSLPTRVCFFTTITGCLLGAVVVYFCWVVYLSAFITLDHYNIMQDVCRDRLLVGFSPHVCGNCLWELTSVCSPVFP